MHSIQMTAKDLKKAEVLQLIESGQITRKEASDFLCISIRQVDRLKNKIRAHGMGALSHGNRGRRSNNKLCDKKRQKISALMHKHYHDFGPTLAAEKLFKHHGIQISVEKLRQIMKEDGLWKAKKRKGAKFHPRRERRYNFGEMLQGDGSTHDWFEKRRDKCVLIALIDDATNRSYGLFFESETIEAYAETMKRYIEQNGKPRSLYVDKDSIFRVNNATEVRSKRETQFGRMMKELNIGLICAHSPEAKGRIERLFGTLQDRLVKEMRLLGISSIMEANEYLESQFWQEYNSRWTHIPSRPEDFHNKKPSQCDMDRVFTLRHERRVSKSLDFSYEGISYQIRSETPNRLAKKKIIIFQKFDGTIWVEFEDKRLDIIPLKNMPRETPIIDSRNINAFLNKKKPMTRIERCRKGMWCPKWKKGQ